MTACLFVVIMTVLTIRYYPAIKYRIAVSRMENGDYETAAKNFNSLDGYKNSEEFFDRCTYEYACELLTDGNYGEALVLFGGIPDYEDSADKIIACQYGYAKEQMVAGNYQAAIALFKELGTYEESPSLLIACYVGYGDTLYADGNYNQAYDAYCMGGLKPEDGEIAACTYQFMLENMSSGDWKAAYNKWLELKDRADVDVSDCTEELISGYVSYMMSIGTVESCTAGLSAITELDAEYVTETIVALEDECSSLLTELKYREAITLYESGSFEESKYLFSQILNYADAAEYYDILTKWRVDITFERNEKRSRYVVDCVLYGGEVDEALEVEYFAYLPDGTIDIHDLSKRGGGFMSLTYYEFGKPEGTIYVEVYNKATGELIGSASQEVPFW